jgi:hypothetical protein
MGRYGNASDSMVPGAARRGPRRWMPGASGEGSDGIDDDQAARAVLAAMFDRKK